MVIDFIGGVRPRKKGISYQEGADFDTSIPMAYQLYPTTDQIIMIWNEGDKSHSTDLLTFKIGYAIIIK